MLLQNFRQFSGELVASSNSFLSDVEVVHAYNRHHGLLGGFGVAPANATAHDTPLAPRSIRIVAHTVVLNLLLRRRGNVGSVVEPRSILLGLVFNVYLSLFKPVFDGSQCGVTIRVDHDAPASAAHVLRG